MQPADLFARNLREARIARGLTQEQLAGRIEMDAQYGKIERGAVSPSVNTLVRIARGLEVAPAELLRGL